MTCPTPNPFKLFFLPGVVGLKDVKAHTKRKYGWLPTGKCKTRSKRKKRK